MFDRGTYMHASLLLEGLGLCFQEALNLKPTIPVRCTTSAVVLTQSPKPFDLKTYWTTLIAKINQKPDKAIPIQLPKWIYEAMRYSGLGEGAKCAWPMICIMACEFFGGNRLAALPSAFVIVHVLVGIVDKLWI
ncbi:hypothetical protein NL676_009405 [Syzygium grande]|nr:hypothetical protein NL676_009405 [Syzygium grande]